MIFVSRQLVRCAGRIGLGLLLGAISLAACNPSAPPTPETEQKQTPDTEQVQVEGITASQQHWEAEKTRHENSYRYTVRFISAFGFGSTTVVTVMDGTVTGRNFEAFTTSGTGTRTVTQSWSETAGDLMSHPEGAEAATLDVIYGRCQEKWLKVDTKTNKTYFENKHNGIISLCGYVPNGCQDDCFEGVRLSAFEWLR